MSILSEKFLSVAAEIAERHSPIVHYPLLSILEQVNGGKREFNRVALQENGIDPDAFLTAWAIGYAKGTLVMNNNHEIYRSVTHSRCQTCLSTDTPDSFGHYMPNDLKERLLAKQTEMAPYRK